MRDVRNLTYGLSRFIYRIQIKLILVFFMAYIPFYLFLTRHLPMSINFVYVREKMTTSSECLEYKFTVVESGVRMNIKNI